MARYMIRFIGVALAALLLHGEVAPAQNPPPRPPKTPVDKSVKKQLSIFTPAREAAAMVFVGQNHPELRKLLVMLKTSDEMAYQAAIRKIFEDSERMAQILTQDPDLHALHLELWQTESRIDLTTARLKKEGTSDPVQEKRLRVLLEKQIDVEIKIARHHIRRTETELEQRKSQLDNKERAADRIVSDRLKKVLGGDAKAVQDPKPAASEDAKAPEKKPDSSAP